MENLDNDVIEMPNIDFIVIATAILFIINGITGLGVLAFLGYDVWFLSLYSGFVLLGVLLRSYHSDTQKGIVGIVGMVASFYAGIFWSFNTIYPFSTIMTIINMAVLGLSFATVCHVTCTWPNYDYD